MVSLVEEGSWRDWGGGRKERLGMPAGDYCQNVPAGTQRHDDTGHTVMS